MPTAGQEAASEAEAIATVADRAEGNAEPAAGDGQVRVPAAAEITAPADIKPTPGAQRAVRWRWRRSSVQSLARAIFTANDPVEVATRLLTGKGDASTARIFTLLLEYLYGKPVQQFEASGAEGEPPIFQFVTHAPSPQHLPATTSTEVSAEPSSGDWQPATAAAGRFATADAHFKEDENE